MAAKNIRVREQTRRPKTIKNLAAIQNLGEKEVTQLQPLILFTYNIKTKT
jgi:hypothetical protein